MRCAGRCRTATSKRTGFSSEKPFFWFLPYSYTVTESRGVRWVGCILRMQLRRARQTKGTHQNGTNKKSREAKRQKAGKRTDFSSHCATYMVLDARECAQRRDVDAHPPSQLGGIARPPGHYVPPPHDTTTTALATTSRESSTTYYSHDATYILHGTRRPPRAAPTSEDESDLFGRTQGRRAPSAPRESVCLGHTHHFPFLGFPAAWDVN